MSLTKEEDKQLRIMLAIVSQLDEKERDKISLIKETAVDIARKDGSIEIYVAALSLAILELNREK